MSATNFDTVGQYLAELELTKAGIVEDTDSFTVNVVETAP